MTVASRHSSAYLDRPTPDGLADVIDLILDKGLVIDVYVRVSLVGVELVTIDARVVMASVDTYLRFAEAVNRLDLGSVAEVAERSPRAVQNHQDGARPTTTSSRRGREH